MSPKNPARPHLHRLAALLSNLWRFAAAGSAVAKPVITNLGVLSGGSSPYSFAGGISAISSGIPRRFFHLRRP